MKRTYTMRFVILLTCLLTLFLTMTDHVVADELSAFAKELLQLNESTEQVLQDHSNVIELNSVVLPEGDALLGVNDHFGHPVATMSGDSIVVIYNRIPYHWNDTTEWDEFSSRSVMVRSTDGGNTWSQPLDLQDRITTPVENCRSGFGNAIGVDSDGAIVAVTNYGVFRSENQGELWSHIPGAFGSDQLGSVLSNGPRLLQHPTYGLLIACHNTAEGEDIPLPELWFRSSTDGGYTWTETKRDMPDYAALAEPCLMMHDGAMLAVARCHSTGGYDSETGTRRYVQFYSETGLVSMEPQLTTISSSAYYQDYGPGSQDTVDVSYNPVSGRIECVATDRFGDVAAGDENAFDCMTLNLWSIDPLDLKNGSSDWEFECTLLKRDGIMAFTEIDGMHPGGAVMDLEAGVQHIFIYAGAPEGPSGIFDLVRTLDTAKLRASITGISVPEPTSISMLISGGLLLLVGLWRRVRYIGNTARTVYGGDTMK